MSILIPPGTQMENYRIEALLGEGGMAQVYRAWHSGLQRHEALKALLPHFAHDRDFAERFLHEARTAAGLHHPNIATIHTVSTPQAAQPYFTMQLIEGGDLSELLCSGHRLSLQEALPLLTQLADALDYAHKRGVIHRDVKPANILLERHGDTQSQLRVKLVDFGIARAQQEGGNTRMTKAGMIVGTPEYMSPEQAEGRTNIDFHTDIYSLGIVAYEMLCGQTPFHGGGDISAISVIMCHLRDLPAPPSLHTPDLPEAVDAALLTALAKNPLQRYSSCTAFVDTLAKALVRPETIPPPAIPMTGSGSSGGIPLHQKHRASRAPALVSLVLALAACSLFAGRAWQQNHNEPPPLPWETRTAKPGTTPGATTEAERLAQQASQEKKLKAEELAQQAKNIIDTALIHIQDLKRKQDASLLVDTEAARAKTEIRQQFSNALTNTQTAIQLDDTNQNAWYQSARAYYYIPDRPNAESVLQQGMQRFPDNNDFRLLKSNLDARK